MRYRLQAASPTGRDSALFHTNVRGFESGVGEKRDEKISGLCGISSGDVIPQGVDGEERGERETERKVNEADEKILNHGRGILPHVFVGHSVALLYVTIFFFGGCVGRPLA